MNWHIVFDILAATSAFAITVLVYRWRLERADQEPVAAFSAGYAVALVLGAALGGYGLGTMNLALSGVPGVGRSIRPASDAPARRSEKSGRAAGSAVSGFRGPSCCPPGTRG